MTRTLSSLSLLDEVPWETRNLQRPSFALNSIFWRHPDESALASELESVHAFHQRAFVQARVPQQFWPTLRVLERHAFCFIESTLEPQIDLDGYTLQRALQGRNEFIPPLYRSGTPQIELADRTNQGLQSRVRDIARTAFVADRFHRDAQCAPAMASQRFVFWINDLWANPTRDIYVLRHLHHIAGFLVCRAGEVDLVAVCPINGRGLGRFLWLSVMNALFERGVPSVQTLISASNLPALNLHAHLGFRFANPAATFHLWLEPTR